MYGAFDIHDVPNLRPVDAENGRKQNPFKKHA